MGMPLNIKSDDASDPVAWSFPLMGVTLVAESAVEIRDVTADQAAAARLAYQRFGRGNHPARLNDGDCFARARAQVTGEPLLLLLEGGDFRQTDITPALRD